MKLKLKLLVVLLAGLAFIYSACKKSGTSPSDPALAPQDVAGQVALNIDQSLFGGLGVDLSGGLNAPTLFAVHSKGKGLESLANPDCSLIVDTTVNYTIQANGSTASISGTVKFSFACTDNIVSGFTTNDKLTIALASSDLSFNYNVGENLTLTALTPLQDNSNLSLSGTLNSNGSYQYHTGTKRSGSEIFTYTLKSVVYSPDAGDVISGSATFSTQGSGPRGVWNYEGTIVFLGNHQATVTISGKVYNVNIQTGVVS